MKWLWICAVVVIPFSVFTACSDDDVQQIIDTFVPPPGMEDEIDCMAAGIEQGRNVVFGLMGLYLKIQDDSFVVNPPNMVDYDLESDPNTFDILWDVDEDGSVAEVHLFGDLIPDDDLNDGLEVGEGVDADWELEVHDVMVGHGFFTVTRVTLTTIRIQGTATFTAGCTVQITAMDIQLDATDIEEGTPSGFINFSTNHDEMTGSFVFDPINEIANISVTYDGQNYSFKFDLNTWEPIYD